MVAECHARFGERDPRVVRARSWIPSSPSRRANRRLTMDFDTPSRRAAADTPPASATSTKVSRSSKSIAFHFSRHRWPHSKASTSQNGTISLMASNRRISPDPVRIQRNRTKGACHVIGIEKFGTVRRSYRGRRRSWPRHCARARRQGLHRLGYGRLDRGSRGSEAGLGRPRQPDGLRHHQGRLCESVGRRRV